MQRYTKLMIFIEKILYIKHENYDILIQIRKMTEEGLKGLEGRDGLTVQYDLT